MDTPLGVLWACVSIRTPRGVSRAAQQPHITEEPAMVQPGIVIYGVSLQGEER